jgi:hypothetical protein
MRKLAIAMLLAGSTGCTFINSLLYGAESSAGQTVGERVGANVSNSAMGPGQAPSSGGAYASSGGGGSMSMATMQPAFLNMYMSVIFTYAFSSGGYDVSQVDYKAGEFTRWNGKGQNGNAVTVERAHLFDDAQGRQWWKVKFTDDQDKTTVLEGLLDPAQRRFVRMRAKFPDDKEGNEMPVDQSSYYAPPQKLSPESIEGATKGVENVRVPAGSFSAKHVVFGGIDGSHEWWLASKVPGGTVKQLLKNSKSDQERWEMELAAYGSDAQSELGSK